MDARGAGSRAWWRHRLGTGGGPGCLDGPAATALEAVPWEAAGYDHSDTLRFLLAMWVIWTTRAMPLAWTAQWGEGRLSPRMLVLVFVAEVLLLSISWDGSAPNWPR